LHSLTNLLFLKKLSNSSFKKRRQKETPHFLFRKKKQKAGLSLQYIGRPTCHPPT